MFLNIEFTENMDANVFNFDEMYGNVNQLAQHAALLFENVSENIDNSK